MLKESGQLDKYWLQWKPQARTDCFVTQSIDPIKIQVVVSLFIMLSAFVLISVAIYIIEVLVKKKVFISANESNSAMKTIDSVSNSSPTRGLLQNKCTVKNLEVALFLDLTLRRVSDTDM